MKTEYVFSHKINGEEDFTGIVSITNPPKLICLCSESQSKLLLNALNAHKQPEGIREELIKFYDYLFTRSVVSGDRVDEYLNKPK